MNIYTTAITIALAGTALSACSTPQTVLKNKETGQVVTCGGSVTGSMVGGVVGYHIQKSNDSDCVTAYLEEGFERVGQKPADDVK